MKKKIVSVILLVVLTMGLVACSSNDSASTTDTSSQETVATTENSGDAEYAVILKTQTTDFWVKMWKGVEEEAKAKGIKVDLYSAQSEDDLEGQLTILESCISKGYQGIAIAPLSSVNVLPGIGEATKKGITIVDVDEKFDETELANQGGAAVAFVATDNVAVGNKGGQYIVDQVEKGAKVAIIEGKSGNQSSEDRAQGAKEAFEEGGLELVSSQAADWDRQKALDIATTLIQQNPDLTGIYCCNDGMALGVVQAVINANKVGEILVVGTDGDEEAITSVANGQLSATVAQNPSSIGATALDLLIEAVEKETKAEVGTFPEKTPVDSILVTKDNAGDFQ